MKFAKLAGQRVRELVGRGVGEVQSLVRPDENRLVVWGHPDGVGGTPKTSDWRKNQIGGHINHPNGAVVVQGYIGPGTRGLIAMPSGRFPTVTGDRRV